MIRCLFLLTGLCMFASVQAATGDTLYVAERLYLSMTAEPMADSQRIRLLESGDVLEEISRQGDFIQVSLADGTSGWVREAYITASVPGNIRAAELEAEITRLQARVVELVNDPAVAETTVVVDPELVAENLRLGEHIAELETELEMIKKQAADVARKTGETTLAKNTRWIIAAAIGLLFIGWILGVSWRSRQVRRRLHGLEI